MEGLEPRVVGLLRLGAEAEVKLALWRGYELVAKERLSKRYRRREIDESIRRQRTAHESRIITRLHELGVPVPVIFFLDLNNSTIYMQRIKGEELRNILPKMGEDDVDKMAENLGEYVGVMHKGGIAHGDLTLSNIIVDENRRIWLVDFGLSVFTNDIEDFAVDIHLLERSIESTLPNMRERFMGKFMKGYEKVVGRDYLETVIERIMEIRRRGRYVTR